MPSPTLCWKVYLRLIERKYILEGLKDPLIIFLFIIKTDTREHRRLKDDTRHLDAELGMIVGTTDICFQHTTPYT